MEAHYRHTTPYYDLVLLSSPARIESLAVDPSGTGRHLGVINNFGRMGTTLFAAHRSLSDEEHNVQVAGRPARVVQTAHHPRGEIRLERVSVGDGVYADWVFSLGERTFDMSISWTIESAQADIWELGWKLDAAARHIGDERDADLASADRGAFADIVRPYLMWWDDDPRYAHTLAVALTPGSAERGDMVRCDIPRDRPTTSGLWCTVFAPGGTELRPGRLEGGSWRFGASDRPGDVGYARALSAEVAGGAAAVPSIRRACTSGRAAALAFGSRLGHTPVASEQVRRGPEDSWLLSDGRVLVAFVRGERRWACRIYVHADSGWQLAATAANHMRFTEVAPEGIDSLAVRGELAGPDGRLQTMTEQVWALRAEPAWVDTAASGTVHVRARDTPLEGHTAHPMHSFLAYPGGQAEADVDRYDVLFSPVLRPQPDLVVGQRAMWSPTVHVQHGPDSFAVIPDLLAHRRPASFGAMPDAEYFGLTLDLDVATRLADAPVLSFGWRTVEGVFGYYFRDVGRTPAEPIDLEYDLVVRTGASRYSVTSDVQRRQWERVGRRYARRSVLPQTQPAESSFDEAWSYWADRYDSAEVGGRTLGAVRVDRVLEPGINFMSWFNALRTSYGLYTMGRDRNDAELTAKGRSTLDLLLSAPQDAGAFPTIADLQDGGVRWQASHRNFLNQLPWGPASYNTFDMGWAAYWLLRWHQDLEPEPRAVEFARAYGEFVLGSQLPSGAVPSWFAVGSLEVSPRLRESAQTASSVMLLAELARVSGDASYLEGAQRAGRYVVQHHLDTQRWDDFEPYYSNTLKSEGASDPFSGQHTQNTLSMHFAAIGLLTLYDLTGEHQWLDHGVRAVDAYLQYQYVSPGIGLSVNCFGGFAVQNTDNEALDARQSQFGVTLLDYARATGRSDYADRGVAALRAGYATMASPSADIINPKYFGAYPTGLGPENYAHATFDAPAEFSMFDWGQGSAAAGFAEARNRFADVWIDARTGLKIGIDDVSVESFDFRGDELAIQLSSPTPGHTVVLKVHGSAVPHTKLRVGDDAPRVVSRAELETGVPVPTRQSIRIAHHPTREVVVLEHSIAVSARISSGEPVDHAVVRYRYPGSAWREAQLHRTDNEVTSRPGTWSGTVPRSSTAEASEIHYYFTASSSSEVRTAPEVDPQDVPYVLGGDRHASGSC